MKYVLTLSILAFPATLMAQESLYEKAEFKADGGVLLYRFLKPAKLLEDVKYPLVVFFHGAGERGNDNKAQLIHGSTLFTSEKNREEFPCYVLFPQCPQKKAWVEVDWGAKKGHKQPSGPSEPMRLTHMLIEKLLDEHPIDARRIYVMGLSMGGFGTWDFAARYPDITAAAVPICGGADHSTAKRLKDIPVWAFHGALDSAVWPVRSRDMVAALKEVDAPVKYTEYEKVGHDSWTPAFREPELLPWMFMQRKKAK